MSIPKWDEAREAQLLKLVGAVTPVTADTVKKAAEALETTDRSVASKLRKMGKEVASMAKDHTKSYTEKEEAELRNFVTKNKGAFTYADLAAKVLGGSRSAKQIQGKLLSMELYEFVKATPKVEREKSYSDAEEQKLLGLLKKGGFIEDIAGAMGREENSIRGKILSMSRNDDSIVIPKKKNYVNKDKVDPITSLGDIKDLTVAEIAEKIGKTERGVKTMITHRGLICKNYDGAKKAEKRAAATASA